LTHDEQKKKDAIFALGVIGLGVMIYMKDRQPKTPGYGPSEPLYERVMKTFGGKTSPVGTSEDIIGRKIDFISKSFDDGVVRRGAMFELQRVGDELIAKSAATENLLRDPSYYDALPEDFEEVG